MPAPIIAGLVDFIGDSLGANVWDGEIPRSDPQGRPIYPDAENTWPVIKVTMPQSGFNREWTQLDPYTDEGTVTIEVWGTSRLQLETPPSGSPVGMLNEIEELLALETNWQLINMGGPNENPFYVISMLLSSWSSVQEDQKRTATGALLYKGTLNYQVRIHGAVNTIR